MDCDEPHLTLNEKMQPIQWTEWPTDTLMAAGSLWPCPRAPIHQSALLNAPLLQHARLLFQLRGLFH